MTASGDELYGLLRSVVLIEAWNVTRSWTGTAFFWSSWKGPGGPFLVTNRHILERADGVAFSLVTRDEEFSEVIREVTVTDLRPRTWLGHFDESVDVAILDCASIGWDVAGHGPMERGDTVVHDRFTISNAGLGPGWGWPRLGEEVLLLGHPDGIRDPVNWAPIVRRGIVATPVDQRSGADWSFLIDASVFPGASGSPVLGSSNDDGGKLLGILASRRLTNTQGLTANDPVHQARESLDLGKVFVVDNVLALERELTFRTMYRSKVCAYVDAGDRVEAVYVDHDGTCHARGRSYRVNQRATSAWSVAGVLRRRREAFTMVDGGRIVGLHAFLDGGVDLLSDIGLQPRSLAEVIEERLDVLMDITHGRPVADEHLF